MATYPYGPIKSLRKCRIAYKIFGKNIVRLWTKKHSIIGYVDCGCDFSKTRCHNHYCCNISRGHQREIMENTTIVKSAVYNEQQLYTFCKFYNIYYSCYLIGKYFYDYHRQLYNILFVDYLFYREIYEIEIGMFAIGTIWLGKPNLL